MISLLGRTTALLLAAVGVPVLVVSSIRGDLIVNEDEEDRRDAR